MPRPRTPLAKAQASGAALIHPGRFKDRKGPKKARAVGEPYASMTDGEKLAWRELTGNMPWLNAAHRTLLHMACRVKARLMAGEDVGISAMTFLSSLLSKLGATPVDETKVNHGGDDEESDPAEGFFG